MTAKRNLVYLGLFFLVAFNYVDRVALSIAAPVISKEFHITPVGMGYLFSSFVWLYLFSLTSWGGLTDRFGAKRINAIGVTIWSAATLLTGAAWSFGSILVTRIVMGAAEASTYPGCAQALREWTPKREYGFAATVLNSGGYFGPALGTFVLGAVVSLTGWRMGFVVAGGLCLVWLVFWLLWYRRPEDATFLSEEERALILRERDVGAPTPGGAPAYEPGGFARLLRCRTMWALAVTQGTAVYSQYLFLTWLPSYLAAVKHLSIMKTGLLTALPYLVATFLSWGIAAASDRLLGLDRAQAGGRRVAVTLSMLSAAVVLFAPMANNVYVILGLITVSLTGVSTSLSLNIALTSDLLRMPRDAGKAMGIQVSGGNIFGLMAPIVTGYIISATGNYNAAFIVAGGLLLVGAAITMTMTRQPIEAARPREAMAG